MKWFVTIVPKGAVKFVIYDEMKEFLRKLSCLKVITAG